MRNWYNWSFVLVLLLFACEDQFQAQVTDFGYDYFPLEVGSYKIYEVMMVTFDAQGPDTSRYQLKTTITESSGGDYYLLRRETRSDEGEEWNISDVWTLRRDQYIAVATEENLPLVKMTFPVVINRQWNGNALNVLGVGNYQFVEASSAIYDDLIGDAGKIQVQIADVPQNLVNQDQRFEVYAKGVGLVEKNYIILNFCTSNCGSNEVDSGIIIEQVLIAYGQD
ncbi:MAG: hypothetical protein ACFHWX_10185 [Bacteroidota bacterium]